MNEVCLILEFEELIDTAKEYFMETCGFLEQTENRNQYLLEGLLVLENCKKSVTPCAMISYMAGDCFQNHVLHLKNMEFRCTAFEQIPDDNIIKVYSYLLTVGHCKANSLNLAEHYYAEVWGEGFMIACREQIRKHILEEVKDDHRDAYVTHSFGPGFYGMAPNKLWDFTQIMDAAEIGVTVEKDGTPYPDKSCGGFFFVVKNREQLPSEICKDCIGNDEGCQFCGGKNRIPSREACCELLHTYGTPEHVIRHCVTVTKVALRIGKALKEKGVDIDLGLLEGASLLHDIARIEDNHGLKGSRIAARHGYHQIANLIKHHMFYISDPSRININEQDILCLADRMVKEDVYIGLETRMNLILAKLEGNPAAAMRIRQRLEENILLRNRIETMIGISIDQLMR